ncbi:MAG: hypothetical protein IPP77_03610 [Bacteroidetes bacterium]|nr:hypothetical protein [Bacteroidota bacterium]
MKRNAILRSYHGLGVPGKLVYSRNVIVHETGNVNFLDPLPTLADKTTATDALEAAAMAASDGDKDKIRIMHEREAEWVKIMDDNADYVEDIAKGNAEIMLSSGHAVTKVDFDKHTKPIQMVVDAFASKGAHGTLEVGTKTVTNSEGILSIAVFGDGVLPVPTVIGDRQIEIEIGGIKIVVMTTTKHRGTMINLPQFKVPKVYMVGFNAAGMGPISNVVSDVMVP